MTDLETVLLAGVQVLSLDPAITKSGRVEIHLRVSGARDRAIHLVQNLEKSRHFADTRISVRRRRKAPARIVMPLRQSRLRLW